MATPIRHVVLDNEAVGALLSTGSRHPKRAKVVEALYAINGRRVVPTAVRGEADWSRADPVAADANRLVPDDDPLDRAATDRAVELRRLVPGASLVDAAVAVAAERLAAHGVVEVLTSDVQDLTALATHLDADVYITRL